MNYIEVLRAFRGLRVIAILLGLLLLAVAITRISLSGAHSPNAVIDSVRSRPGAVVREAVAPDGTKVTTVDVPGEATHMVVRENRRVGTEVTITEPESRAQHLRKYGALIGNFQYADLIPGRVMVREQFNPVIPFEFALVFALIPLFILATMLAGPLARENEHLEIAWTRPVSRERYALSAMGTDALAMVAALVLTIGVVSLAIALFTPPVYSVSNRTLPTLAFVLLGPIAWYAMLTAASASLKRGLYRVVGIAWPVAFLVTAMANGPIGSSSTALAVYKTFHFLNYFNPLGYLSHMSATISDRGHLSVNLSPAFGIGMLALLIVVYVAAAVLQWRRVEA